VELVKAPVVSLIFFPLLITVTLEKIIIITDDACELKVNSSIKILSVNETWSSSDEPCTFYKCTRESGGETHVDIMQKECDNLCGDGFVYKTQPNECCGKCVEAFCTSGDRKFRAGEIWKSFDNCTVNECIDTGVDLVVTSYKKSCPKLKNCPEDNIEMRDCCPYCNYRSQRKF
jgi:hypothetical protein